jgi:hypothetical protein
VVERLALGDRNEDSTIYKPSHNLGGNSIVKVQVDKFTAGHACPLGERSRCAVRVFDDWAREHGIERVDFIKTDTEGPRLRRAQGRAAVPERTDRGP